MGESKDVVGRFLAQGYSLDSASLEFFMKNPVQADDFLRIAKEMLSEKRPAIVTLDYVGRTLKSVPGSGAVACDRARILKDFSYGRETKASVADAVSARLTEYDGARNLLSEKMDDIVSINKLQKQQRFSLIVGMLEKTGEESAVVEDATGTLTLAFEDRKEFASVMGGDIFGAVCETTENGPIVKRIVWPDLPLKRDIVSYGKDALVVFIAGADRYAAGFEAKSFEKFVKWSGENAGRNQHIVALSGPEHSKDVEELLQGLPANICRSIAPAQALFEICGLRVLSCTGDSISAYRKRWGTDGNIMVNLMKRRTAPLGPVRGCGGSEGHATFFDAVPDVFVSTGSKEPSASNYKGTSVISIGSFSDVPVFFSIDLRTRDFNKLDLS